ncbi:MAG: hypothetical protein L0220_17215 [Acidobacteria bacterium]|nr:hypothetical protein [Acidobacteriota bacterium]
MQEIKPQNENGEITGAGIEPQDEATSEIKTRVEGVLTRIRSDAAASDTVGIEVQRAGDEKASARPTLSVPSASSSIKSITAELEKRRSELFAMVRVAEARTREADEHWKKAEARLAEETELRQMTDKQLRDLEDEYLQKVGFAEAEELKRREAEVALAETDAKLKELEIRMSEAEWLVSEEVNARKMAEEALLEAEEKTAKTLQEAAEADRKKAEAEAKAREAEEKAEQSLREMAEAEQRRIDAELKARQAEENAREIESLIDEAEAIARSANDRYKTAESRLQQELEMRASAEERLKAMEDELSYYLDVEWTKMDPPGAPFNVSPDEVIQVPQLREETGWQQQIREETARQLLMQEEMARQLQGQIDAEKKSRINAEQSYAAAEAKIYELEAELRKTEDRYRQSEAGMKKVLRKQEADLRSLSEQVQNNKQSTTPLSIIGKPLDSGRKFSDQDVFKGKLKLVGFGIIIGLLVAIGFVLSYVLLYKLF